MRITVDMDFVRIVQMATEIDRSINTSWDDFFRSRIHPHITEVRFLL